MKAKPYPELNIVLHDDLAALAAARIAEDARIVKWVEGLSQADFERDFQYANMAGDPSQTGWTCCSVTSSITRPTIAARRTP